MTQSPEMKVQQGQLDTLKRIEAVINRLAGPDANRADKNNGMKYSEPPEEKTGGFFLCH